MLKSLNIALVLLVAQLPEKVQSQTPLPEYEYGDEVPTTDDIIFMENPPEPGEEPEPNVTEILVDPNMPVFEPTFGEPASKLPPGLEWVQASDGNVPEGAVFNDGPNFGEYYGAGYFVGQVVFRHPDNSSGMFPGIVSPIQGGAFITYGGEVYFSPRYMVLAKSANSKIDLRWVKSRSGLIPPNAVPGGVRRETDPVGDPLGGNVLYIGRAGSPSCGDYTCAYPPVGKVLKAGFWFPNPVSVGDNEVFLSDDYEILTYAYY